MIMIGQPPDTVQRVTDLGGEPLGVCVGFELDPRECRRLRVDVDEWPLADDDAVSDYADQYPDGEIQVTPEAGDLRVWRTREEAIADLALGAGL